MNDFPMSASRRRWSALLAVWAVLAGLGCVRPSPPAPAAEPEPVQVVWMFEGAESPGPPQSALEEVPAEPAAFHILEDCLVTHYDICALCCGKTDGITASGTRAEPYATCAVDPAVIPLGAELLVDCGGGQRYLCRAEDTGSGVSGRHIDLCVASHEEAVRLGLRRATVYWREPA